MRSDRQLSKGILSRRLRTLGLAVGASLATLMAVAPTGAFAAGTLDFFDNFDGTSTFTFTAGAGDVNNVTLSVSGTTTTITDSGATITVSVYSDPGCTGSGTNTVSCTGPGIFPRVQAGDANDTLIGSPGAEALDGEAGSDAVRGNDGEDFVAGGSGDGVPDDLEGGADADGFNLGVFDGGDAIKGGPGIDSLRATSGFLAPGFRYTLNDGLPNDGGPAQEANIFGVEDITTGEGLDFVRGTDGGNSITTFDGDDDVDGLAGPDRISTGSQNDTVEARDGYRDRIQCGSGIDIASVDQLDEPSGCEQLVASFVQPAGTTAPQAPPAAPSPGAGASSSASAPSAAVDTTAPTCTTSVKGTISDLGAPIVVRGSCDEPSTLAVKLTAPVKGTPVVAKAGEITLAERTVAPQSGTQTTVRLKIPRRLRAAVGPRGRLRLGVAATDAAGNAAATSTTTIRVRRRR